MAAYPKINVNFSKMDKEGLLKVSKYYGMNPAPDKSQAELAALVAHTFESQKVAESDVVDKFVSKFCRSTADVTCQNRKRMSTTSFYREQLDSEPARIGEQVAAKVSSESGSWILANTLDYDTTTLMYELQDEDDINRVMQLGYNEVKRLEDSAAHIRRGDLVLAVFPETTSFYRAEVVKNPRHPQHGNGCWEVIVRFEDDEDETGRAPPRRVPARFVLLRTDVSDFDDDEKADGEAMAAVGDDGAALPVGAGVGVGAGAGAGAAVTAAAAGAATVAGAGAAAVAMAATGGSAVATGTGAGPVPMETDDPTN